MLRPATQDIEVCTLQFMLDRGQWAPREVAHIQRQLEDRKAQILAGLGSPTQIFWTAKVQMELDVNCRVRRDPIHGWFLDRWIDDPACWHPVGYIGTGGQLIHTENGDYIDNDKVRPDLIEYLKAHDMQRPGYFTEKAAKSAAIRLANEKANTNKVLMAVDSLSNARLKNFIEVEKAIQTGETVTMHGKSFEMFERMTEAGKKAPEELPAVDPAGHPQVRKRNYSKGEGESYGKDG